MCRWWGGIILPDVHIGSRAVIGAGKASQNLPFASLTSQPGDFRSSLRKHYLVSVRIVHDADLDVIALRNGKDLDVERVEFFKPPLKVRFDKGDRGMSGAVLVHKNLQPSALRKFPLDEVVHGPRVRRPTEEIVVPDLCLFEVGNCNTREYILEHVSRTREAGICSTEGAMSGDSERKCSAMARNVVTSIQGVGGTLRGDANESIALIGESGSGRARR